MKKITKCIFVIVNIAVIAMMLVTGFAAIINPVSHPYLSLLGFAFPAFLVANICFMVFWALVAPSRLLIPFFGMLLAYNPVQYYSPINGYSEVPEGSLKILSYNVLNFSSETIPTEGSHPILQYLIDSKADIMCFQEYVRIGGHDSLWNVIDSLYPYHEKVRSSGYAGPGGAVVAVYSKYPILSKENIDVETKANTIGAFTLDVHGEKVNLINVHLESIGFSEEERQQFNDIVRGKKEKSEIKREAKTIVAKLAQSAVVRAPQADKVAEFIESKRGERVILCGDFNDHPLSYVHHTISRSLIDCYRYSGHWPGFSFHYYSMYVRIDNIMCSEHWKPYGCVVDKSIAYSDHYPIYCFLNEENNVE